MKQKEIFSEEIYGILFIPAKNMYLIYNAGHEPYKNLCVEFTIYGTDFIYIRVLSKCIMSGTNTLEKMDILAKKLEIRELQYDVHLWKEVYLQ